MQKDESITKTPITVMVCFFFFFIHVKGAQQLLCIHPSCLYIKTKIFPPPPPFFHLFAPDRHVSSMCAHTHYRKANILGTVFITLASFRYFPNATGIDVSIILSTFLNGSLYTNISITI